MSAAKFLQFHTLTSYPASLLNRDDVGFAKRIRFGGHARTRVSSQCLKRHWRTHEGENSLTTVDASIGTSVRSRQTFARFIHDPLLEAGVEAEVADAVTEAMMVTVLGESAKAKKDKKSKGDEKPSHHTGQVTVLGRPELEFLLGEAKAIAEGLKPGKTLDKDAKAAAKKRFSGEAKKNIQALRAAAGLDAAMFGRMVTSDLLARTDAAIHVAHAFTVHAEASESDYFAAVDDLMREDNEMGSGHIGSVELTTGLYYGYVVIDLPLLVSNIEGCTRAAWDSHWSPTVAEVVRRMVHLITTVSPGAKLGSTAPHAYSQLVLAERGNAQPRTLANAFLNPIGRGDMLNLAYKRLASHLADYDAMYGTQEQRRFAALGPVAALEAALSTEQRTTMPELATWAAEGPADA